MVCIFSRGMLGVSALVIATACASAPSQQQTKGSGIESSSMRSDDLQSRSSGVYIQDAGDGQIRVTLAGGRSSLGATRFTPSAGADPKPENVALGSSTPLYVLNGVPYTPGPNGLLTGINPRDIESIKALKEPTDLALYGMRGGNGVIVITTKQPRAKSDSTKQRPRD